MHHDGKKMKNVPVTIIALILVISLVCGFAFLTAATSYVDRLDARSEQRLEIETKRAARSELNGIVDQLIVGSAATSGLASLADYMQWSRSFVLDAMGDVSYDTTAAKLDESKATVVLTYLNNREILVSQGLDLLNRWPEVSLVSDYVVLSETLLSTGQFDESIRVANLGLKHQSISARTENNARMRLTSLLGTAYFLAGNVEQGREAFRSAIQLAEQIYASEIERITIQSRVHITWGKCELAVDVDTSTIRSNVEEHCRFVRDKLMVYENRGNRVCDELLCTAKSIEAQAVFKHDETQPIVSQVRRRIARSKLTEEATEKALTEDGRPYTSQPGVEPVFSGPTRSIFLQPDSLDEEESSKVLLASGTDEGSAGSSQVEKVKYSIANGTVRSPDKNDIIKCQDLIESGHRIIRITRDVDLPDGRLEKRHLTAFSPHANGNVPEDQISLYGLALEAMGWKEQSETVGYMNERGEFDSRVITTFTRNRFDAGVLDETTHVIVLACVKKFKGWGWIVQWEMDETSNASIPVLIHNLSTDESANAGNLPILQQRPSAQLFPVENSPPPPEFAPPPPLEIIPKPPRISGPIAAPPSERLPGE